MELFLTFNRRDTKYHGGLRSRELCQAPILQALSSHSRVCESKLSSWNNFFQSCQGQALNRVPSDKKASAKSTFRLHSAVHMKICQASKLSKMKNAQGTSGYILHLDTLEERKSLWEQIYQNLLF